MGDLSRRIVVLAAIVFFVIFAAALYVGLRVAGDLASVSGLLSNPSQRTGESAQRALAQVKAARGHLRSLPARVLDYVPVAAQNVAAARSTLDLLVPALAATADSLDEAEDALGDGLIKAGTIDVGAISRLEEPLERQSQAFIKLARTLRSSLSGWLLPPMWDKLDQLRIEAAQWGATLRNASEATMLSRAMLGDEEPRDYLIMVMNNAELRGSGGILSGVGTLRVLNGHFSLGRFTHYGAVARYPQQKIQVPPDIKRRFARYNSDEAVLVNATASPDVPESAITAISVYETVTGRKLEGALLADPRGLAALLPDGARISVSGRDQPLTKEGFTRYVYSDVYRTPLGSQRARRAVTIDLGRIAIDTVLRSGLRDMNAIREVANAIGGGHLRFFSLDPFEQEVLTALGATGELTPTTDDSILVTVQNLGADKLDYWMRRNVGHYCTISGHKATCRTEVEITNNAPDGLPGYVVQERSKPSYAMYEGYLEVYVPEEARLQGVELDSHEVRFYEEREDERTSVGLFFDVGQKATARVAVAYELALDGGTYSLEITPQPLPVDATFTVQIAAPSGWSLVGPEGEVRRTLQLSGRLDRPVRIEAADRLRTRTGIANVWERLVRFWSQPLF
jgi:uncharacterized protein DUF4012